MAGPTTDNHDEFEAFCEKVRQMDEKSLEELPNYIDLRQNTGRNRHPLLRSSRRTGHLQNDTVAVQGAYFDFCGRCMDPVCGIKSRHPHSVQLTGVKEVEGFPGLYIYRRLFVWVQWDLISKLMHEALSNPANSTNLDAEYRIVYPQVSEATTRIPSFFGVEGARLTMEPRLRENWDKWPITSRQVIDKLETVDLHESEESKSRPLKQIGKLCESLMPIKASKMQMHISGPQHLYSMPDGNDANDRLNISIGCSGIAVIGLNKRSDASSATAPNVDEGNDAPKDDDSSWLDLVTGLDSDEDKTLDDSDLRQDSDTPKLATPVESNLELIAVRLDSGDGILLSGESAKARYQIAQVLSGSMPHWETEWPCTPYHPEWLQSWKTCMHGKRIDLLVQ